MKLLHCTLCNDIVALHHEERFCVCGESHGRYVDNRMVEYSGPAMILGINNSEMKKVREAEIEKVLLSWTHWKDYNFFVINEGDHTRKVK